MASKNIQVESGTQSSMLLFNTDTPSFDSTDAGALFVSGAALWYKGGSGTITKLANA